MEQGSTTNLNIHASDGLLCSMNILLKPLKASVENTVSCFGRSSDLRLLNQSHEEDPALINSIS
jgi:hypothetical protein